MNRYSLKHENKNLDLIFRYFMETILHIQQNGLDGLPLENPLPEPSRPFLDAAMGIFLEADPPELSRLLLEAEFAAACRQGVTAEDALCFQLIKEISWHIYYGQDFYAYLFSTGNLWGSETSAYAAQCFYPRLPADIREKYKIPSPPV